MSPIETPYKIFTDLKGEPLSRGSVYIGVADANPVTSPATVYWDAAGTQPALQPLNVQNGYIVRAGTPANVYTSVAYSILVNDSRGRRVFYSRNSNDFSVAAAIFSFIALLATSAGSALIGFIQLFAGAVLRTVQSKLRDGPLTPQDFGAVGGGLVDDTAAFEKLFATLMPWYIPEVAGGYLISRSLTISANGHCDGFFVPTTAIAIANPLDVDRFAIIIASGGYAQKRFIKGLRVIGNVTLRAALVKGIRNDCENSILESCYVSQLDYGIVVRSYSVTLKKCNAAQCNTNLDAYAPAANKEINALTIDGGNYDSGVDYSANIGDLRWAIALPAGTSHGVCINIINGANFDGGEVNIDNCSVVNINGIYHETSPTTGVLLRLGGSGDGNLRNVTIKENFLKNANYAIRCGSAVEKLSVRKNFITQIAVCEVWLTSDIYGIDYAPGVQVGSFSQGQPVRIAFRSVGIASIAFPNFTMEQDYLISGCQDTTEPPTKWYPGGAKRNGGNRTINVSSAACAFYTTPSLAKAGTVLGTTFTFTTPAQCYAFNGGDRIDTVPAGAQYVRSVDYLAGTMVIDGGVTPNGAATVSQVLVITAAAA